MLLLSPCNISSCERRQYNAVILSVILNLPFRQIQHFLTIDEINLKLSEKFFPELDIIDHRKKKDIIKPEYPMRGEWYHKYDNSGIFKNGVGLDKVSFSIHGDMQVELSVNDLCAGFTLGLSTIEEVGTFLMTHKTFDLVDYGTC